MAPKKKVKLDVPMSDIHFPAWEVGIDAADKAFGEEEVFQKESVIDLLRKKWQRGEAEVRVLRVSPTGRFVDVTDENRDSNPLNPENFVSFRDETGQTFPIDRDPKSREEAMNFLREILPDLKANGKQASIRRMEKALEESAKTLEHWKE
jgi:hypothetical protein